jgi:hypothetical protein
MSVVSLPGDPMPGAVPDSMVDSLTARLVKKANL